MKIIHQYQKCIGCGSCAVVCPAYFEMGEDGLAHLKGAAEENDEEILETNEEAGELKEAADICPVQIIKIIK